MDLWLSDAELKGIDFNDKAYGKNYAVKLGDGRSFTLVSSRENQNISHESFIPYALIDKGIDNSMVSVDDIGDMLIYQNEYIQCLDALKASGIPVERLIEVDRVQLTREQLGILVGDNLKAQKVKSGKSQTQTVKLAAMIGVLCLAGFALFQVI